MRFDLSLNVPFIRFARVVPHAPGFVYGPRRLYDHLLLYVDTGYGEIEIDGIAYSSWPGQLFLVPPSVVNRHTTDMRETQNYISIHFDWVPRPDTASFQFFRPAEDPVDESLFREPQCVPGWDWHKAPWLDLRGRPTVRERMLDVVKTYWQHNEFSRIAAGGLLAVVLAQVALEARLLTDVAQNPAIGAAVVRRVHQARELLEMPSAKPPTVAEVARQVGWSADHLNRMCRKVLGVSPQALSTAARIRRAKTMLRENSPVQLVAVRCGFCDTAHFNRVFKAETGLTPYEYLKEPEVTGRAGEE